MRKESYQIVRDPSSIAIGIVMPLILILLFGFALSLDVKNAPIAIVVEDPSPATSEFAADFRLSPYFDAHFLTSMREAQELMLERKVDGIVRIRANFARGLDLQKAQVQILLYGADANRARIILGYAQGAVGTWAALRSATGEPVSGGPVVIDNRMWFNEANDSHYFLVPGLIVMVMTLIGAFLTTMVMAREWERGTLEALFVTPVRVDEILLGKTLPYFAMGLIGLTFCFLAAEFLFHVPFRGSLLVLAGASVLYLLIALGIGLLISSAVKSQFVASQLTMVVTYLAGDDAFGIHLRSAQRARRGAGHRLYFSGALFRVAAADGVPGRKHLDDHPAERRGHGRHGSRPAAAVDARDAQEDRMRRDMWESLLRIFALVHKELLAVLKDPRSRYSLFCRPSCNV